MYFRMVSKYQKINSNAKLNLNHILVYNVFKM